MLREPLALDENLGYLSFTAGIRQAFQEQQ